MRLQVINFNKSVTANIKDHLILDIGHAQIQRLQGVQIVQQLFYDEAPLRKVIKHILVATSIKN